MSDGFLECQFQFIEDVWQKSDVLEQTLSTLHQKCGVFDTVYYFLIVLNENNHGFDT